MSAPMKTSEALRLAKAELWDGRPSMGPVRKRFICHAADEAGVAHIVRPLLAGLLDGHATLEGWLTAHHPRRTRARGGFFDPGLSRTGHRTRHAWLDHLIAHYESKGD